MADTTKNIIPRSDVGIGKLRLPAARPIEYGDGSGLRLALTPVGKSGRGGSKVWRWYVKLDGKMTLVTLGPWSKDARPGTLTLSGARQKLDEMKKAHAGGILPDELEKARAHEPSVAKAGAELVLDVVREFKPVISELRDDPSEVIRTLDKVILPALGDRPIRSIKATDIAPLIRAEAKRAPTMAGKVLAHTKQLFRFAVGNAYLDASVADALDGRHLGVINRKGKRFLTAQEIVAFWRALDQSRLTPAVRLLLKLLLLLGTRSGETLLAEWDEFDFDVATWTIPVGHQKLTQKQRDHDPKPWVVPLPPTALALLKELQAFAKSLGSNYVAASFATGGKPLTGKALVQGMRGLFEGKVPLLVFPGERPTPHDLRRTLRTNLVENLKVQVHVAERCLNHTLGGVLGVYDQADFLDDRRDALEKWDAYVERLLASPPATAPAKVRTSGKATPRK